MGNHKIRLSLLTGFLLLIGLGCLALVVGWSFIRPTPHTYAIALGDLDGDADLDAVFVNGESEAPHPNLVLINQGGAQGGRNGNFKDSGQRLGRLLSREVVLGDLDGDGDLDAWIGNNTYQSLYFNDGRGALSGNPLAFGTGEGPVGSGLWTLALGDLDADGDLDVLGGGCCGAIASASGEITAVYPPINMIWLNQNGFQGGKAGSFGEAGQPLESMGAEGVALGDLDGDGDLDAVFGNDFITDPEGELNNGQPNTVWWNDGLGNLSDSKQRLGSARTKDVALGDVDGDNDIDIFSANYGPDEVWYNLGSGIFQDSGQRLGDAYSSRVFLKDLDGDGDLDAAVTLLNRPGGRATLEIRLNQGGGIFGEVSQSITPARAQAFQLGDMDQDGDLDVFAGWFESSFQVWWNRGDGRFRP